MIKITYVLVYILITYFDKKLINEGRQSEYSNPSFTN
jgi:hypothetical protein